jgi:NAD+ kinase
MGKLGFLSSISKEDVIKGIDDLLQKKYSFDQRTLLRLESDNQLFGDLNFALNDISIYKKAPNSMITIQAYINDDYLNSYWGDGLIISTPTGSTGYSMSCGGPIIVPDSQNFVITPIATHNLTVRPIVISDQSVIRLRIEGRAESCIINLDSRYVEVDISTDLVIRKESFEISLVRMENQDFFRTIRTKLNWGLDVRN